jgi:hypothetical protein
MSSNGNSNSSLTPFHPSDVDRDDSVVRRPIMLVKRSKLSLKGSVHTPGFCTRRIIVVSFDIPNGLHSRQSVTAYHDSELPTSLEI